MAIRGILFDKDGTLFDFNASWGQWAAGLVETLSQSPDHKEALADALGYDLATMKFLPHSQAIAGTANDICDLLLPLLPQMTLAQLLRVINQQAAQLNMVEVLPLADYLSKLRAMGLRLGVATNDSEAPAKRHLAAHKVEHLFDFIAGYDSGFGAKPGAGMCKAFAQSQGLDPAEIYMVGDSLHDLHAGRAAGMKTIAVLTGVARAQELRPHADLVLSDIGEILALLEPDLALAP